MNGNVSDQFKPRPIAGIRQDATGINAVATTINVSGKHVVIVGPDAKTLLAALAELSLPRVNPWDPSLFQPTTLVKTDKVVFKED